MIKKTNSLYVCVVLLLYIFVSPGLFSKVKVSEPVKDNIKTGNLLSAAGTMGISNFLDVNRIDKNNLPIMFPVKGDETLIVLRSKERALIIDTVNGKPVQQIELPSVENIFRIKGTDFFLVVNMAEKIRMISRYEPGSGKAAWTIPFDMEYGFNWGAGNYYRRIQFPVRYRLINDGGTILFTGIRIIGKGKKGYYSNRLLYVDAKTGKTIREHDYHYRRYVEGTLEFYVDKNKKAFDIIDLSNGKLFMKGTYKDEDIPEALYRYNFIGNSRVRKLLTGGTISSEWEFSVMLLDEGQLLLTTRRFINKLKFGVSQSYWVILNPEEGTRKKIVPAPLGGVDMALRNMSGKKWPVIIPHVIYQSGFRRPKSNSFWIINSDGDMKQVTAPPPIPEEKIPFTYNPYHSHQWIHDGEYIYYLHSPLPKIFKKVVSDRKLFKIKIGESRAEVIYTYGDKQVTSNILAGAGGHLVLTGEKRRILVKVPEGKEVSETNFSDGLGTLIWRNVAEKQYFQTWKQVSNTGYLHKNLAKEERPPNYSTFIHYNFRTKDAKPTPTLREMLINTIPTVWGISEGFAEIRDIGLVPARLKDKTAVMCGIDIINDKIEFYLPILLIDKRKSLISVTVLDESEAVLTVLSDLSTITFYRLKRPGG